MTYEDLTIADVLKDPLIRLMMRADGISVRTMKALLIGASHVKQSQPRPQPRLLSRPKPGGSGRPPRK